MKRAIDVKINIKPVFSNRTHTAFWEGPCRVGDPEHLSPEYERRAGREQCKLWYKQLKENISSEYANVLEPVYIEFTENFYISDEQFDQLKPDLNETDIFLMSYRASGIERFGKPMSMINRGPTPIDLGAYYADIGKEFYFAYDYEEYNELLKLLQVRKAIRNTKILVLTTGEQSPVSVVSSNPDLFGLNLKYGIRGARRSMKDVFGVMDKIDVDEKVSKRADALIAGAGNVAVSKEHMMNDLRYMEAVKSMMEELGCNAFTTACMELCASQLPMKYKCTPCLTHSLLKDSGIPTACEEDINAWMAVMVFMYLSKKSVFMGNASLVKPHQRPLEDLHVSELVSGSPDGFDDYALEIRHSVPGLKMEGFDEGDMTYDVGQFTFAGWGTKIQIDMANAKTKTVTIGRFSRDGSSFMIARGEILGCAYHKYGCSPDVYYKVEGGAREFVHALAEKKYGHHLVAVYGDYIDEIKELGKIVGFNVEVHK